MITPVPVVAESTSWKADRFEPEFANSRRPEPSTSGWVNRTNSSTRLAGISDLTSTPLPKTTRFSSTSSLSLATASAGSPWRSAEFCYDVADEISEGDAAAKLDPALTRAVRAAYLVPGGGVVDPGGLIAGLTKAVIERGADIREHTEVIGLVRRHNAVVAVQTTADELTCSAVAITAGTWSAQLLRMVGCRIPLQAAKGYSFTVELDPAPRHALYLGDRKIAVSPLAGTTTRIAGTMELSGNNRRLDWRRIVAVARGSRDYLGPWFADPDDLATQIRDPRVGARPLLPDGIPLIDRLSADSNVFAATGHGMLGVTLGPATGSALADYLRTGRCPATLAPFTIDRR